MPAPATAPTLEAAAGEGQARITVTATETASTLAWVTRQGPDGLWRRVRAMQGVPLLNRQATGYDHEVPLGVPVTYCAWVTDADPANASPKVYASAQVPYGATQLCSATTPYWKAAAPIQSISGMQRAVAYGAHYVLGRPAPITIADVRQSATFTLTPATITEGDADSLRALLDANPHLLLQAAPEEGGNLYFLCTTYTEERAVPVAAYPDRLWSLECIQVDPPAAPLADTGRGTYAQLTTAYATFAALPFASYAELALWNGPA